VGSRLQAPHAGSPLVPATLHVLVLAQAERYLVDLGSADFTLHIVSELHSPDLSRADLLIVEASEQDENGSLVGVRLPVLVLVPPQRQIAPNLDARRSYLAVPGRRDQLEGWSCTIPRWSAQRNRIWRSRSLLGNEKSSSSLPGVTPMRLSRQRSDCVKTPSRRTSPQSLASWVPIRGPRPLPSPHDAVWSCSDPAPQYQSRSFDRSLSASWSTGPPASAGSFHRFRHGENDVLPGDGAGDRVARAQASPGAVVGAVGVGDGRPWREPG
jgi:hypothetical protein